METTDVAVAQLAFGDRRAGNSRPIAEQLVSLIDPGSYAADQYRVLRHLVERVRKANGLQVLAVTSPGPGDGKSVTTLNLAGALAQAPDARVVVIDADLRKPSVAGYLGLDPLRLAGLADALQDDGCHLSQVVRPLRGFNLAVVPAGRAQQLPYELLNSPRFATLIDEARRQYDCVIIDTPPIVPVPDCRALDRSVDGFMVVVAAHRTPRSLVADALRLIDPARLVGVVFNADERGRGYGYGGYYGRPTARRAGWWQRTFGSARNGH
jgi:capsular exopolysaccharide synthesis family protein